MGTDEYQNLKLETWGSSIPNLNPWNLSCSRQCFVYTFALWLHTFHNRSAAVKHNAGKNIQNASIYARHTHRIPNTSGSGVLLNLLACNSLRSNSPMPASATGCLPPSLHFAMRETSRDRRTCGILSRGSASAVSSLISDSRCSVEPLRQFRWRKPGPLWWPCPFSTVTSPSASII